MKSGREVSVDVRCPDCGKPAVFATPPQIDTYVMASDVGDGKPVQVVLIKPEPCCRRRPTVWIEIRGSTVALSRTTSVPLDFARHEDENGNALY